MQNIFYVLYICLEDSARVAVNKQENTKVNMHNYSEDSELEIVFSVKCKLVKQIIFIFTRPGPYVGPSHGIDVSACVSACLSHPIYIFFIMMDDG